MKQLLETMCGEDFLSKHPEEALDFLGYVAEASKGWDKPNLRDGKNETSTQYKGWHVLSSGGHGHESQSFNLN